MPRPRRIPQNTLDEIVRQRMFGASFGQIAKVCKVSKTSAHRHAHDVPIVCGRRHRKDPPSSCKTGIVPIPGGGYRIVTF